MYLKVDDSAHLKVDDLAVGNEGANKKNQWIRRIPCRTPLFIQNSYLQYGSFLKLRGLYQYSFS